MGDSTAKDHVQVLDVAQLLQQAMSAPPPPAPEAPEAEPTPDPEPAPAS